MPASWGTESGGLINSSHKVYVKAGGNLLHAMPQKLFASYLRLPYSPSEWEAQKGFLRLAPFRSYRTAEGLSVIKKWDMFKLPHPPTLPSLIDMSVYGSILW